MTVLLVLGFFVVLSTAHNITFLEVPQYGDPRVGTNLACYYISEKGDPPIHSVKWYRDNNEIFRYTPGQQPSTRTFNTTANIVNKGSCSLHSCSINVSLPKRYNTKITFMCEVSTEGPRFAVVKQTKSLVVAVTLPEDPVITGMPGTVQTGEEVNLNCSTAPATPPANILWYIDGKPEFEPWLNEKTETAVVDADGLRVSWRALKLRVDNPQGIIILKCEATQPTRPPYVRSTNVSLIVARSPNLGKFTAPGSHQPTLKAAVSLLTACTLVHVSKCSAFSNV